MRIDFYAINDDIFVKPNWKGSFFLDSKKYYIIWIYYKEVCASTTCTLENQLGESDNSWLFVTLFTEAEVITVLLQN